MKRFGKQMEQERCEREANATQENISSQREKLEAIESIREKYGEAAASLGVAYLQTGDSSNRFMSGQVTEKLAVENGALSYAEQQSMSVEQQLDYAKGRLHGLEKMVGGGTTYSTNALKAHQQLEEAKRTGRAAPREKRVVGFICGDEPPADRARMWVDLLLCPSGEACLMGQCTWITGTFLGYDALMKGCNADALEGACALVGLAGMVAHGDPTDVGAVVHALSERAEKTAPALLQWIAHQPVGQDYMYGGHWKRPSKSSTSLPMSPLLATDAAAKMMNALVRLLRLMADAQTHVLHAGAMSFVNSCLKAPHLPQAIRRLVQLVVRRDRLPESAHPTMAELPSMAITTLHSMCAHPSIAVALREHPRALDVMQRQCANDEAAASHTEEEVQCKLHALLKHCATEQLAPPSACRPVGKLECDHCAATCQRMKTCTCMKVKYCDAICQKADWRQHKKTCLARQEKKEKKEKKAAAQAARAGPTDPSTGRPLAKDADGAYKVGHLAGADGRVNMWDIPGVGADDHFDTPMNVRMPTDGMMLAIERQRQLNPKFDPMAEINRLGVEGFASLYLS